LKYLDCQLTSYPNRGKLSASKRRTKGNNEMAVAILAITPFLVLALGGISLWNDKRKTHAEFVAMLERAEN
jgi:hypothetical protein